MSTREFTAVYQKRGKYYIAWIEEIPGVNVQAITKKETKENLKEALKLILNANRSISKKRLSIKQNLQLEKEPIHVAIPA